MFTKAFWKTVAERAALAGLAVVMGSMSDGDLFNLNWADVGRTALSMAVLSAIAAALPIGGTGNPMLAYPPNMPVVRKETVR